MMPKIEKTDEEWKKELTPEQYRVMRQKGTDPAFNNEYWNNHEKGHYRCASCGEEIFTSDKKYDSGTGWPSFTAPVDPEKVAIEGDNSFGMVRDEVVCSRCGGHLGHIFDDGPVEEGGKRYCMNSTSLKFEKEA